MSSNPPKPPRLIVANKQALKELEAAGLRDRTMKKYDATLPFQLKGGRKKDDEKPDQQILDELRQTPHLRDVSEDDLATAALLIQGAFGDGARVVGLPEVLNREVEWLMLSREGENVSMTDRRALSSEALTDETFPEGVGQKHEAIAKERSSPEQHNVERKWDGARSKLTPFQGRSEPSLTEYYKRMGRVALDDGSIHKGEALEQLAKTRYDELLKFELGEVPRQISALEKYVKASQGKYTDITQIPPSEFNVAHSTLREEYIDVDILQRKKALDEYSNPKTTPAQKREIEMGFVAGRHQTPPNHIKKISSQNLAFSTVSPDKKLEGMVLEQMKNYNESRYPSVPLDILR
jgi:hypothetical protein